VYFVHTERYRAHQYSKATLVMAQNKLQKDFWFWCDGSNERPVFIFALLRGSAATPTKTSLE
jgi:hypothetical protein